MYNLFRIQFEKEISYEKKIKKYFSHNYDSYNGTEYQMTHAWATMENGFYKCLNCDRIMGSVR